ncbi:MAG: squalene/phytoene synthase family protein [Planctomycetota bacterium]
MVYPSNRMPDLAFLLRRPMLLARDLLVDREDPDLSRLSAETDPERFVWSILPHAARTFSACIALLPAPAARAAAVAYLYCRCLDTYEDLLPDPDERDRTLAAFAARLDGVSPRIAPGPPIDDAAVRDARDAAHVLLVTRHELVDRVFVALPSEVRGLIVDLVRDMADGMRWSSRIFAENGGVLRGEDDVLLYCRHVIGNPVVFTVRLIRFLRTGDSELSAELREDSMRVGELVQLANVTRDIEKDLRRGVAYLPELRKDLGRNVRGNAVATERVRKVRARLLDLALARAPSYRRMVEGMRPPMLSLGRASAMLMLLFTERYYRGCAVRAGRGSWPGPSSGFELLFRSFGAFWSGKWADREMRRIERRFLAQVRPTASA